MVHQKGTRQVLDTTRGHQAPTDRTEKAQRGVLFGQSTNHWKTGLEEVTSQVEKWCWREVLDEPSRQPARNQNNQRGTHRGVLFGQSGIGIGDKCKIG